MSITPPTEVARPPRGGLAVKLFAILLLLGVVAILVTGILGYVRGRDALEAAIYNQLTAQRQSKTRQVENYFRSTADDLRLLAQTKMVADALRDFRHGFEAIQEKDVPAEMRRTVEQWYDEHYIPTIRHLLDKDVPVSTFLPKGPGAHYLQYHYIVANPHSAARRRLMNDAGDGSAYSAAHAVYHPLMREAATTVGFRPQGASLERAAAALQSHGIDAVIVPDAAAAKAAVLGRVPKGSDVFTMTSVTLDATGISAALNDGPDYVSVRNRLYALDRATQGAEMRAIGSAPAFAVGSVHAVTEAGELMMASATGSQLPAYAYGAGHVVFVVGAQKIVKDLAEANERIQTYTLPLEDVRAKAAYGVNSAINKSLILHREQPGRIDVVIVAEEIGF